MAVETCLSSKENAKKEKNLQCMQKNSFHKKFVSITWWDMLVATSMILLKKSTSWSCKEAWQCTSMPKLLLNSSYLSRDWREMLKEPNSKSRNNNAYPYFCVYFGWWKARKIFSRKNILQNILYTWAREKTTRAERAGEIFNSLTSN